MGDDDSIHHPGDAECDLAGVDVRLPAQTAEPGGERQIGERVPAPHGGVDAGKQM